MWQCQCCVPGLWLLLGMLILGAWPVSVQASDRVGPPLPMSGFYTNRTEHWAGRYHALRQGRQVTVTLATHRSPVGHATQPQLLFQLPEGYRPVLPVTWATVARPMTAQGWLRPEVPTVTVILEVQPDGMVYHVDTPTLEEAGYVGYRTAMTWTTDEAALFVAGTFTSAAGAGTYRLVRLGNTVTAILAAPAAPGLDVALSPHLFTVPLGFRPVEEMTWTVPTTAVVSVEMSVSGWVPREVVGPGFDLRVHRDGRVIPVNPTRQAGYVAEVMWRTLDSGWMEAQGTYEIPMTWTAGADVCRRHAWVQAVLMRALHWRDSCIKVTWTDLTAIEELHLHPGFGVFSAATIREWFESALPLQAHDLAGLTGLKKLELLDSAWLPAVLSDLLVHTPALEVLHLSSPSPWLPLDFLAYASRLRALTLEAAELTELSLDVLAHTPWLEALTLEVPASWAELPVDWLAPTPVLEHLTLEAAGLTELPPDLLVHVPGLRSLTLRTPKLTELPVDWLAPTPVLEHLTLEAAGLTELPPDLLVHVPGLRSLTLRTPKLTELPVDWLAPTPVLEHLTLGAAGLTELPPDLLVHVPGLRSLTLRTPKLTELPVDWLAPTPVLEHLTLEAAGLTELPPDLLDSVSELQCLFLVATNVTTDFHHVWEREINTRCPLFLGIFGLVFPWCCRRRRPHFHADQTMGGVPSLAVTGLPLSRPVKKITATGRACSRCQGPVGKGSTIRRQPSV